MSAPILSYTESDMQIDDDDLDDEQTDDTDGLFKMEEEDDTSRQQQAQKVQCQQNRQHPYIPAVNIHDGVNVESVLPTSFVGSPATGNVYLSSPAPPLAPDTLVTAQADILADVYLEEPRDVGKVPSQIPPSNISANIPSRAWPNIDSKEPVSGFDAPVRSSSQAPPSFSDLVKRSTRFITSVPAHDVLQKLSYTLEGMNNNLILYCFGFHFLL